VSIIISRGAPVRAQAAAPWPSGAPTTYSGSGSVPLWGGRSATYEQIVFTQPWVYAAVRTFYLALSRLPEKVYLGLEGDERRRTREHELARLLRTPFPGGSSFDRKGALAFNLFTHGNHLELKQLPGTDREPTALWPVPWTWVTVKADGRGTPLEYVIRPAGVGETIKARPNEVVHYRLMGGRSPLEPLRRTLGIEDAATDWQLQALENGPSLRGAFSTDKVLQDRTIPRLRAELEALYGGPGGKALGIFDQNLRFNSLSQSAADVSLIETRKATREEAAAAFGIPAPMIGILDHATYSNISELRRSFYVDTVAPYCTLIEETEQAQLIGPVSRWVREGVFTEFELAEILKPDPLAEAQSIMLLTSSGTTSTNDNRKLKRLDPVGDPADPANPYNRPRVPANLLDPESDTARAGPNALHEQLVLDALRAGHEPTSQKEASHEPPVPAG